MTLEEERLSKIEKILLEHIGKEHAIPANKIAPNIGVYEDDTVSTTRGLITKLIGKTNLPIGSCESGYYIMQTEEELNEVVHDLNGRIYGIYDRIRKLTNNFNQYNEKNVKPMEPKDDDL